MHCSTLVVDSLEKYTTAPPSQFVEDKKREFVETELVL